MKNKDYQKKFKDTRKKKGYIRKEVWIKPEWWPEFLKLKQKKEKQDG